MNLKDVLKELKKRGYSVGIKVFNKDEFIYGGIEESDGNLKLGTEIRIRKEGNNLIFIEVEGQTYIEKNFNDKNLLLNFIEKKYPLQN